MDVTNRIMRETGDAAEALRIADAMRTLGYVPSLTAHGLLAEQEGGPSFRSPPAGLAVIVAKGGAMHRIDSARMVHVRGARVFLATRGSFIRVEGILA